MTCPELVLGVHSAFFVLLMLCKGYGSFDMEPNRYEFEIGGYILGA